jgi:hypothetical protein
MDELLLKQGVLDLDHVVGHVVDLGLGLVLLLGLDDGAEQLHGVLALKKVSEVETDEHDGGLLQVVEDSNGGRVEVEGDEQRH